MSDAEHFYCPGCVRVIRIPAAGPTRARWLLDHLDAHATGVRGDPYAARLREAVLDAKIILREAAGA